MALIIVLIMMTVYMTYTFQKVETILSNLALSNMEALADNEGITPLDCYTAHCCYDPSADCFGYHDGGWRYCYDMRGY
ncbi:NVEALA domain-containing protein [Bacteroides sp.]|uniref:NVEALA domain-containing protein n=1 Tax=Bacteroides sp. TaxID=29523 RepID=UPI00345D7EEA